MIQTTIAIILLVLAIAFLGTQNFGAGILLLIPAWLFNNWGRRYRKRKRHNELLTALDQKEK